MAGGLPAISGYKLMTLLEADGWQKLRQSPHGRAYAKNFPSGPRVTTIQRTSNSLSPGTLRAILGKKQTGLGRAGLLRLLRQ